MVCPVSHQFEQTIKSDILLTGTMALSGRRSKVLIKPAKAGSGIQFLRSDVPQDKARVKADWHHVCKIKSNYSLRNQYNVYVHRVDNLLAALHCFGIDNALIVLESSEVPFIHNQPSIFLDAIREVGIKQQSKEKQVICINQNIEVKVCDLFAIFMPASSARISFNNLSREQENNQILSFLHPHNGKAGDESSGHLHQLESFSKRNNLAAHRINEITNPKQPPGISLPSQCKADNINRNGIVSILSTMALTGITLVGHLYTNKPDNEVLHLLIDKLLNEPQYWSHLSYSDFMNMSNGELNEIS